METPLFSRIVPVFGLISLIVICLIFSTDRRQALRRWPIIAWGLGLQFAFAVVVLKTSWGKWFFEKVNDAFVALINCTYAGTEFVFGPSGAPFGSRTFATESFVRDLVGGNVDAMNSGFVLGTFLFGSIIFFSALSSVLYHLGVLQFIVRCIAWVMMRTMGTSGAETLSASANIFIGQTEAPLLIKPYLRRMSNSELMTVMTGGFATIAGSVMGAYISILGTSIPNIGGHLLAASIMSAPAALLFGKLLVPETETPETAGQLQVSVERESANVIDAAASGTSDGVRLALNVIGMLIAFLALLALVDLLLGAIGSWLGLSPGLLSVRGLLSWIFAPFAWMLGITEWSEAIRVGELLGLKMAANEFIAYLDLASIEEGVLSERSRIIASYALCGFANIGSIGIQIGGLAAIAPERRTDLSRLGLRAMIAGTFACNATACIAAILI